MSVETIEPSQNGHTTATTSELAELHPAEERRIMSMAAIAVASGDHSQIAPAGICGIRKAAIVGFAPTTIQLAPYANNAIDKPGTGYELFGLNELYKVPGVPDTKFSMWCDLHDRRDGDFSHRDPENIEWLAKFKGPVFMQEHYDDIPTSVAYPLHEVVRFYRTTYWTNSISYMLAVLGMAGRDQHGNVVDAAAAYGEVHVYGVDMAQEDKALGTGEYSWQRPSCEYMIGFLRGMGIKVYVPRESDLLLTPFLYGYEGDGQAMRAKWKARRAQLVEQSNAFKQNSQTNLLNAAATEGASKAFANAAEQLLKNGKIPQADHDELMKHSALLMEQAGQMRAMAHNQQLQQAGLDGALEDVNYTERAFAPERYGSALPLAVEP